MACSDAELLAGLGSDPVKFGAFYRRHVDKMLAFVVRRVSSPEDAADLTQAIFVAVIESADRFDAVRGSPIGWLYGVARNTVAGWRRQQSRRTHAMARLGGHRLLVPDEYEALEDRIALAHRGAEIAAAMEMLPDSQRLLLELVSDHGLTTPQAAEALGISGATARMRLSRARRTVRRCLSPPSSQFEHDSTHEPPHHEWTVAR